MNTKKAQSFGSDYLYYAKKTYTNPQFWKDVVSDAGHGAFEGLLWGGAPGAAAGALAYPIANLGITTVFDPEKYSKDIPKQEVQNLLRPQQGQPINISLSKVFSPNVLAGATMGSLLGSIGSTLFDSSTPSGALLGAVLGALGGKAFEYMKKQ